MTPSQSLALSSVGLGVLADIGLTIWWEEMPPWWLLLVVFCLVTGAFHRALLSMAADQNRTDRP